MYITFLFIKFHTPSFSGSLIIIIKPKDKYVFRVAAMFLLYIPQKLLYNHTQYSGSCFRTVELALVTRLLHKFK
jgi:hypothetical protein